MALSPSDLLDQWLSTRVAPDAAEWLSERVASALREGENAAFLTAFSTAPRRTGRAALSLDETDVAAADAARPGWRPARWRVDQAARTLLVLALPAGDAESYSRSLDRLFADSDEGELVTLYQALPLLPHPAAHRARTAEGIRSNMKTVFDAIAVDNPYPSEMLDEAAWNQLVLKCLFVGTRLESVQGVDERSNPTLARMLCDFAHERWSAGRPVPPELWRSVGPHADGSMLADLERVLATGTDLERAAVALSARHNPNAEPLFVAHGRDAERALSAFPSWKAIVQALSV
jgi:hypothetical protein